MLGITGRVVGLALLGLLVTGSLAAKPWSKKAPPPADPTAVPVQLKVLLPLEKAEVWIDDKRTKQKGLERWYVTPPLTPGTYIITIKAVWMEKETQVTAVRTLRFQAQAKEVEVDFRKAKLEKEPASAESEK
jgi:uncharacterized protein (TIGR03000 family)